MRYMQWKFGPVWQPCRGQSKTGSTQSFDAHPLPPSEVLPELLELLVPKMLPSGNTKPPDDDDEEEDEEVDDVEVSSCSEASSPVVVVPPSSPGAHALQPPLVLTPPDEPDKPDEPPPAPAPPELL